MKIILEHNTKILKTIELTALQGKALKLMGGEDPVEFLTHKIERILEFVLEQAKQVYAKHRLEDATDVELGTIADEIASETASEEPDTP